MKRKIIFVHQAKSGGTTLVKIFRETYGRANVYLDIDAHAIPGKQGAVNKLKMMIWPRGKYKDRAHCKVIHGHFTLEKYSEIFPAAFTLTFYRDPIQRLLSAYYYWLRTPHLAELNPLCKWLHTEHPDIVTFAKRVSATDKTYCKLFKPESFDFVGITERQDESLMLLKLHLPELNISVEPQRVNPNKGVKDGYQLSDYEKQELSTILGSRITLYNEAVARFDRDLKENEMRLL